jgi:hypothetical protein
MQFTNSKLLVTNFGTSWARYDHSAFAITYLNGFEAFIITELLGEYACEIISFGTYCYYRCAAKEVH